MSNYIKFYYWYCLNHRYPLKCCKVWLIKKNDTKEWELLYKYVITIYIPYWLWITFEKN